MLPKAVVTIVQIAAGYVVGNVANDTLNKAANGIKKIVEAKKKGAN